MTEQQPPAPTVSDAVALLGHRTKLEILRLLAHHDACLRRDILIGVHVQGPTLTQNLYQLERARLITTNRDARGGTHARPTRYTINTGHVRALRERGWHHLTGP